MIKLLALVVLFVAVSANTAPRHRYEVNRNRILGDRQLRGGRIVGGADSRIEDFPYQIGLFFRNGHTCGGSILSQHTVLSAAHCTYGRDQSSGAFSVLAGHADIRTNARVDAIWVADHPQYDDWTIENDVTVLRLASNLVFTDQVRYINLPAPNLQVLPPSNAVVSGWGDLLYNARDYPDILQHVVVPVLTNAQCQAIYDEEEILPQHICAGETGRDACHGDSGGPLVYNNIQVGVVSWGYGCAMDWPTVYARVSEYLGFITQQMSRP